MNRVRFAQPGDAAPSRLASGGFWRLLQQELGELLGGVGEGDEDKHSGAWPQPSGVPTGVARFAEGISIRRYAEQSNNIVHWSEFDRGGHFAALEAPDLLIGDVREFFRPHR